MHYNTAAAQQRKSTYAVLVKEQTGVWDCVDFPEEPMDTEGFEELDNLLDGCTLDGVIDESEVLEDESVWANVDECEFTEWGVKLYSQGTWIWLVTKYNDNTWSITSDTQRFTGYGFNQLNAWLDVLKKRCNCA